MRIGLTGGIGCGKSTAGKLLEAKGFRRLDSDAIVRRLLAENDAVIDAVCAQFGPELRLPEGGIDRRALAKIVFGDADALTWLEALLHPLVGQTWQAALENTPEADWVVEIPLLFEKNLEKHFEITVTVLCTEKLQLLRLAHKGLTAAQAKARMERQLPLDEKASKSDIVLTNEGSLAFLERQIEAMLRAITH